MSEQYVGSESADEPTRSGATRWGGTSYSSEHADRLIILMAQATIPDSIATGCPELDRAWAAFAHGILEKQGIMIPDTDDDLSWHAFLGHSIDMQGWRAAEFVGVDTLTKDAPDFTSLQTRGIGVRELGELWDVDSIREHLLHGTAGLPISATLDVLRRDGGDIGESFADAYAAFPWRKAHMAIRAYLQNSAALEGYGYSFRRWLQAECTAFGFDEFPPRDFRAPARIAGRTTTLEWALAQRLEESFYQVGPTMAPYMLCDWQLWLWNHGKTGVFEAFKPDEFHIQFVATYGEGVVPGDRWQFIDWWLSQYPTIPPRIVNECIWLAMETRLV